MDSQCCHRLRWLNYRKLRQTSSHTIWWQVVFPRALLPWSRLTASYTASLLGWSGFSPCLLLTHCGWQMERNGAFISAHFRGLIPLLCGSVHLGRWLWWCMGRRRFTSRRTGSREGIQEGAVVGCRSKGILPVTYFLWKLPQPPSWVPTWLGTKVQHIKLRGGGTFQIQTATLALKFSPLFFWFLFFLTFL